MYNFILQFSLMASLGVMIYLMARALPRVGDELAESDQSKIDQWFSALPLDKIDSAFGKFAEKFLRRVRLILLRFDNLVNNRLNHLRKTKGNGRNGNGKPNIFTTNGNGNGHVNSFAEEVRSDETDSGENNSSFKSYK